MKVKAILVNEIFNQAHLPLMESSEGQQHDLSWRMVKFKYGKKPQVRNLVSECERRNRLLRCSSFYDH